MAAAVYGAEGSCEGEGSFTGAAAAVSTVVKEWLAEESFELNGNWIALSVSSDGECVKLALLTPATDVFVGVWDSDQLVTAGFGRTVDTPTRLRLLRRALEGEPSITTALTVADDSDAMQLGISVPVGDFYSVEVKLRMQRAAESEALSQRLRQALVENEELKATARLREERFGELETETKATKLQLATVRTELDAATEKIQRLEIALVKSLTENDTLKSEARYRELPECFGELKAMSKPMASASAALQYYTPEYYTVEYTRVSAFEAISKKEINWYTLEVTKKLKVVFDKAGVGGMRELKQYLQTQKTKVLFALLCVLEEHLTLTIAKFVYLRFIGSRVGIIHKAKLRTVVRSQIDGMFPEKHLSLDLCDEHLAKQLSMDCIANQLLDTIAGDYMPKSFSFGPEQVFYTSTC